MPKTILGQTKQISMRVVGIGSIHCSFCQRLESSCKNLLPIEEKRGIILAKQDGSTIEMCNHCAEVLDSSL